MFSRSACDLSQAGGNTSDDGNKGPAGVAEVAALDAGGHILHIGEETQTDEMGREEIVCDGTNGVVLHVVDDPGIGTYHKRTDQNLMDTCDGIGSGNFG